MRNRFTVLFILIGLIGCGEEFHDYRTRGSSSNADSLSIRDGSVPATGVFRDVVLVSDGEILCSGIQVALNAVLTAAHCARNPRDLFVQIPGGGKIPATAVSVHSDWSESIGDPDLAVLRFDVPLNDSFRKIATKAPSAGNSIQIAGYGRDRNGAAGKLLVGSAVLRAVARMVSANGNQYRSGAIITSAFQLGSRSQIACPGDSGGPAFDDKGQLVGTVSFGDSPECAEASEVVYMNAVFFRSWILSKAVPFHNAKKPADVNGDRLVNVADLVLVVQEIRRSGARVLTPREPKSANRFDANGDGMLSIADINLIVGEIRANQ